LAAGPSRTSTRSDSSSPNESSARPGNGRTPATRHDSSEGTRPPSGTSPRTSRRTDRTSAHTYTCCLPARRRRENSCHSLSQIGFKRQMFIALRPDACGPSNAATARQSQPTRDMSKAHTIGGVFPPFCKSVTVASSLAYGGLTRRTEWVTEGGVPRRPLCRQISLPQTLGHPIIFGDSQFGVLGCGRQGIVTVWWVQGCRG
jgi:hypothetical protein